MRDSPKESVFCVIFKKQDYGPFFFEGNMTSDVYLQMLQNWLMHELAANEHKDFIFQQDRAPPHCVGLTSMKICEGGGFGMLVMETMC